MKKLLCSLMAALIAFSGCAALAAGKLEVTHENLMLLDEYGFEGYAFARVENTGDKPIKINAGVMELYNADGDAITSSDYLYAYGSEQLNPGEYTYVQLSASDSEVEIADVADHLLTITGKSDKDYVASRFPVTTELALNVEDDYYTTSYMYATVTNDTDEPVYDICVALALLDADGNILYLTDETLYNKALLPGGSILIREEIPSYFSESFEKNGYGTPASVDAIAYVQTYQP